MKRARHGGQIATARALRREAMKPSGAFPISTAIQEAFAKAVKVTKVKSIAPAERILTEKRDTLSVELEQVTPEKAFAWLNHANDGNRSIRDTKVNTYTDDMMNGKWTNCETPISFYKDGFLANGQHRLTAIVASKTTQLFPIYRGLNREDGLNIDTGLTRTVVDNGRISGLDTHLSNALVATARAFHTGRQADRSKPVSNAETLEIVDMYRAGCEWAVSNGPKGKRLSSAVIKAAIARAWYHTDDHEKLKRFCEVMNTGFSDGEKESAAIAIRNYFTEGAGGADWPQDFKKVQNAIKAFLDGRKLTIIKPVQDDTFPIDGRRLKKKAL